VNLFWELTHFLSFYHPQQIEYIISRPDMISQVAHNIKNLAKSETGEDHEVFIDIRCQLNFRPLKQFTNPKYDITSHPTYDWPYPWLEPAPGVTEEMLSEYPWNFKWTFSWFKTFPECSLADNNEIMELQRKAAMEARAAKEAKAKEAKAKEEKAKETQDSLPEIESN
jgi:hypothetical protein